MKTKMSSLVLAGVLATGAVSASHRAAEVGVDGSSAATDGSSAAHAPAIEEVVVYGRRMSFRPDDQLLAAELREQIRVMHEQLKAAMRVELAAAPPTGTDTSLVVNLPQT
ncbi:MAG TPA: hypothetical protein VF339_02985 [Gammaproteobacteria bacterium]